MQLRAVGRRGALLREVELPVALRAAMMDRRVRSVIEMSCRLIAARRESRRGRSRWLTAPLRPGRPVPGFGRTPRRCIGSPAGARQRLRKRQPPAGGLRELWHHWQPTCAIRLRGRIRRTSNGAALSKCLTLDPAWPGLPSVSTPSERRASLGTCPAAAEAGMPARASRDPYRPGTRFLRPLEWHILATDAPGSSFEGHGPGRGTGGRAATKE